MSFFGKEFSSITQNDIKSINSTNFIHLYQDKDSNNKNSDPQTERSNNQAKSLTGIQKFSFIGNKDKSGKKIGFGIQKWKGGSTYKGYFNNNKQEGWGIFYNSEGDIHKGFFENGITCLEWGSV